MAARLDSAAKYLCALSDWRLFNLPLQKILYVAQMEYMGRNDGARLVDTDFEAWDNGPVSPSLYHKLKAFGSYPVRDVFAAARKFRESDARATLLGRVYGELENKRPGALIELTHWESGAWAKNYEPGVRGIKIPDRDILGEYNLRRLAGAPAR